MLSILDADYTYSMDGPETARYEESKRREAESVRHYRGAKVGMLTLLLGAFVAYRMKHMASVIGSTPPMVISALIANQITREQEVWVRQICKDGWTEDGEAVEARWYEVLAVLDRRVVVQADRAQGRLSARGRRAAAQARLGRENEAVVGL
ncbi:hypothetical protein P7C70_g1503, partial [Phenoliferia sp. Uapishka_3]